MLHNQSDKVVINDLSSCMPEYSCISIRPNVSSLEVENILKGPYNL